MKKKKKLGRVRRGTALRMIGIALIAYVLVTCLLLIGMTPEQYDIVVGYPASIDILATKDVTDTVTTEASRKRAADQVEESYKSVDDSVLGTVTASMNESFAALLALRDGAEAVDAATISADELELLNFTLPVPITREQYLALLQADADTLTQLFTSATTGVREALISVLPEGQEDAAVSRVSRSLTSTGYPALLVNIADAVMRKCVQPNMLIDTEITEANRQKAMDAVEPKTFLKGEAIVRRGERVTEAQYQMLSTLGLLKEDTLDVQLIGGTALLVLLILSALAMYLWCFEREQINPKSITLLSLIFVLVLTLSLILSYWNTYLMPVSLGIMLIALLIHRRMALFAGFALSVITSLLANASSGQFTMAMFSFIVMSIVSGPVILWVFSRWQQRVTTLLAGVLVGLSNFLVTFSVGLVNSSEMSVILSNALWAMASGLLSAVLCIGIQPLIELVFNLATNAKLIELSNPNQPLLRRLLLEAPGTYHHSIIVANLAEAAANAIGANGLLARVGAYYHDVGKLKRPGYFTENQVGDNPHDRTDPRVSAAILTAHPRDGYALAQKARIPEPVLDIIRQHHGDGITLYFYDKAVKQYGADQVDISAFRYDGPRPHSKEAAAVMLADTIEAATRSIPNPTPEKIDAMIRKLVRGKLEDDQLDESSLTFSDLEKVCGAFSTVLTGVFHERIEYPDIVLPPRSEQSAAQEAAEDKGPSVRPAQAKPVAEEPQQCAAVGTKHSTDAAPARTVTERPSAQTQGAATTPAATPCAGKGAASKTAAAPVRTAADTCKAAPAKPAAAEPVPESVPARAAAEDPPKPASMKAPCVESPKPAGPVPGTTRREPGPSAPVMNPPQSAVNVAPTAAAVRQDAPASQEVRIDGH